MAINDYQIIRRSVEEGGKHGWEREEPTQNFKVPLVGFSDYNENINVDDIISVILQNNTQTQFITGNRYETDLTICTPEVYGSYYLREEHFFRVTNKTNSKFDVVPMFIDDKIIVKRIDENINKNINVEIKNFSKYYQLIEIYIENPEYYNLPENYEALWDWEIQRFNDGKQSNKLKLPYSNYKTTIFNIWNNEYLIELEKLIENCHKLFPNNINEIGTIELIKQNMDELYNEIKHIKYINLNVCYYYIKDSCLDFPKITHSISKLKYRDIFRIYKPDPSSKLIKTRELTNWSGIILPNESRNCTTVGNLIRFLVDGYGCIYMTILYKLTDKRFLATVRNIYLSNYEDIVIVIDTDAIHEVPVGWEENKSYAEYENIIEGPGYIITGSRDIPDAEKIDLTYDDLVFNCK